jgi:hypothetical protein
MRVLKTEDCFYVGGGDDGDGRDGGGHDGYANSGGGSEGGSDSNVAAGGKPTHAQVVTTCVAIALSMPTPPGFVRACIEAGTNGGGSGGSPSNPYGPWGSYSGSGEASG